LTLHTNAQCLAEAQRELSLLTDLYSLRSQAVPKLQSLRVDSLLDCQRIRQDCREMLQCESERPVAARVLLDAPTQRQDGDALTVSVEAQMGLLYLDTEDKLQSVTRRTTLECQTALAAGCSCRPEASVTGEVLCAPTAEGAELRFAVQFTLPSYANTELSSVASCELSDLPESGRQPSLIVRTVREGESLWSIAKACRSTPEAIANLNGDFTPGTLLLIPCLAVC